MSALATDLCHEEMAADQLALVTLDDVTQAVDRIRAVWDNSGSEEAAHSMESFLHRNVLRAVADQHVFGILFAREALNSERIGFPQVVRMTAPTCPEFCRCDPTLCATDDTGDHCVESRCAICLDGCPLGDDCDDPRHWFTPVS